MRGKAERRVLDGVAEKRCTGCRDWFPDSPAGFHRINGGLHARCKRCACAAVKKIQAQQRLAEAAERRRRLLRIAAAPQIVANLNDPFLMLDRLTVDWGQTPKECHAQ